jgi:hypothetical protein
MFGREPRDEMTPHGLRMNRPRLLQGFASGPGDGNLRTIFNRLRSREQIALLHARELMRDSALVPVQRKGQLSLTQSSVTDLR